MNSKITTTLSLLVVVASSAWLAFYSYEKINAKILEDIQVVSHSNIYKEKGYPVYTVELVQNKEAQFITEITLNGYDPKKKIYTALVSQDKARTIKKGSNVYIPRNEDALRSGFSWEDTSNYILGEVVSVSREADWKTGFYEIDIKLEEQLARQPFYSAKVVSATKKNIIVAPIVTLDIINGEYFAWVEDENSKAVQRAIKTGICDGYNCEIISGLKAGDKIITSDRKLLVDGMLLNDRGAN